MKKRILALALAGTTAFSVFGGAMSANAATTIYWGGDYSSHVDANDKAYYQSYVAAGDLYWSTKTTDITLTDSEIWGYVASGVKLVKTEDGTDSYIPAKSTIYMWNTNDFTGNKDLYTVKSLNDLGEGRQTSVTDFIEDVMRYGHVKTAAGKVKISGETYVVARNNSSSATDNASTTYVVIPEDDAIPTGFTALTGTNWDVYYNPADFTDPVATMQTVYLPTKTDGTGNEIVLNNAVVNLIDGYAEDHDMEYFITDNTLYPTKDSVTLTSLEGIWGKAVKSEKYTDRGVYNVHDYTALSPITGDFDAVMDEEVRNGVVYLYDYYYGVEYPASVDAEEFAEGWADGTLADTLADAKKSDSGSIAPEFGYSYRSVRGDVLDAWENFLDDLGISDASASEITVWARNLAANYAYTYYDATVIVDAGYDVTKGQWYITFDSASVDLYNFGDLLEDILELAPASNPDLDDVQTSEFVYLMQQYEKYTSEGFVDVNPVETSDWGDLLVALAEAPTADEFATTNAYKRYTNAVEDLVEAYVEADTSVAVSLAESLLYDFVTDYNSAYKYDSKADTSALSAAIDATVFNYNWLGASEVYLGMTNPGGVTTSNMVDKKYEHAWALYPAYDYSGSYTGSEPGVDTKITSGVSGEYYWFYNVYDLAYNVYVNNKYQSTIDLMADTLNAAVDALAPSRNARASDIHGAEEAGEALESLIETDYISSIWANKTKIENYINDRVSNDEIGPNGTNNAEDIAEKTASLMGWQSYQSVVTRSDINSVKTAKSNAQAALTALRNDEDKYNAAQANALEKAIETCDYIIDIYNGDYSNSQYTQSVDTNYNGAVGDKDQILKSDITKAVQAVEDAINFKNVIMGWYDSTGDGDWMYGVADTYDSDLTWGTEDPLSGPHYLNFGWAKIGNTWFYFDEDGVALQSDWLQDGNDYYYFNSNCGAAIGWARVDSKWYYFNGGCRMMTGWVKVDGNYYYLSSSGAMVTGWCQVGGKWYYLSQASNSLGQMLYSTTTPDGYQVGADGALVE